MYLSRTALGEELARLETVPIDDDTIVVPVPDTSKAAADAMAYRLGIPSREGLIRNRYVGRTFIEGPNSRRRKVEAKYTPLPEVLRGKRVLLVEDSIVRSTTLRVLLDRIRLVGGAKEVHVRVASPPIIALLLRHRHVDCGRTLRPKYYQSLANRPTRNIFDLGPTRCITCRWKRSPEPWVATATTLQATITGEYPTPYGQKLYQIALSRSVNSAAESSHLRIRQTRPDVGPGGRGLCRRKVPPGLPVFRLLSLI